jgi:hypothetical protein
MTSLYRSQKQSSFAEVAHPSGPLLQRKCACGGSPGPSGHCEECAKKRRPTEHSGRPGPQLPIRRTDDKAEQEAERVASTAVSEKSGAVLYSLGEAAGSETAVAPPVVHEVLQSGGQALDSAVARPMAQRLGHDFGRVRIHTDARANESARAVNAQAYTVGEHVVFDTGRYSPTTSEGQRLITHELTHVIQQRGAAPSCQRQAGGSLLAGTHKPGGPSLHLVGAEKIMGFNVTKAMCPCKEGDLLDRQITKDERAIAAYKDCGRSARSTGDLFPCILPKVFGQQAGVRGAAQVPPAGMTSSETGNITQANEAEIKKRAQLLNLPETGPCAELLRAGNLVHERQHVAQHEQVAAEQGPAFAAEYNRLTWDEQRMAKLRVKFPSETAQYEKKVTEDIQYAVQREVEAYQQEKHFYTQAKAALGQICAVPSPTITHP